ncbi:hypothetical protein WBG78_28535 [Chryseolinea sp. T2]|uniref:hypothetical protein n=1 Tax=Chryseolinea sp. T2 TaxID=3129255 RepID=UPI0030780542
MTIIKHIRHWLKMRELYKFFYAVFYRMPSPVPVSDYKHMILVYYAGFSGTQPYLEARTPKNTVSFEHTGFLQHPSAIFHKQHVLMNHKFVIKNHPQETGNFPTGYNSLTIKMKYNPNLTPKRVFNILKPHKYPVWGKDKPRDFYEFLERQNIPFIDLTPSKESGGTVTVELDGNNIETPYTYHKAKGVDAYGIYSQDLGIFIEADTFEEGIAIFIKAVKRRHEIMKDRETDGKEHPSG